jgi:hypothetical protein
VIAELGPVEIGAALVMACRMLAVMTAPGHLQSVALDIVEGDRIVI